MMCTPCVMNSLKELLNSLLYEVCCREGRCMVTLDLDFADVLRFPPEICGGLVVIRAPRNPSLALLEELISQFLDVVVETSPVGQLWIVEIGRIRIHQSEEGVI